MNNKSQQGVFEALETSAIGYTNQDGNTIPFVSLEHHAIHDIFAIERLVERISKTTADQFTIGHNKITKTILINRTKLGELIINELRKDNYIKKTYLPMHEASPRYELFAKVANERGIANLINNCPPFFDYEKRNFVDVLNGFVRKIRAEANSKKFAVKIKNRNRSANKNAQELKKYIDALFFKYARLLVVRIDLGYLKEHSPAAADDLSEAYKSARKHRVDFFRKMRSNGAIFNNLIGFVWKLEYGLHKGFHYHLLLFFDGSKSREDITLSKAIGEYWTNNITKGTGLYYNCNAHKSQYKSCGIGMINHFDKELIDSLKDKVATYMTKTDAYLRVIAPGNDKSFGKGNMPARDNTKTGRPRMDQEERFLRGGFSHFTPAAASN